MRGRDEETGEFRDDSRSQQRREALEVLAIGQQLVVRKLYPRPDLTDGAAVPAGAAALSDGASKGKADTKADSGGNGSAKAPPPSPRKKKKRSGRRR